MKTGRKRGRWAALAVIVLGAGLWVMLLLGARPLLRQLVARLAAGALHESVSVESIRVFPLIAAIEVRGLRIRSPAGFRQPTMLSMPYLFADGRWRDWFRRDRLRLSVLIVDIEELAYERRPDGVSNWDALQESAAAGTAGAGTGLEKVKFEVCWRGPQWRALPLPASVLGSGRRLPPPVPAATGDSRLQVGLLVLTLRTVHAADAMSPVVGDMDLDLNLHQRAYESITDEQALAARIMPEMLGTMLQQGKEQP